MSEPKRTHSPKTPEQRKTMLVEGHKMTEERHDGPAKRLAARIKFWEESNLNLHSDNFHKPGSYKK